MKLFALISAVAADDRNGAWIGDKGNFQDLLFDDQRRTIWPT